jgi:cytochrome c biogenesis protein CcmG, thiol:disulfide interchange protein DsbE
MKIDWKLIIPGILLLVVAFIALASLFFTSTKLHRGEPAPEFTLSDETGVSHSLSEYRGKNVLLVFSFSNCSACEEAYPYIVKAGSTRPELEIVIISSGLPQEISEMKIKYGIHYTFLTGLDTVKSSYDVKGAPQYVLVDKNGLVNATAIGLVEPAELDKFLEALQK